MFKIIWNKNNLWNKANWIYKLFQFNFDIPNTLIIECSNDYIINLDDLFNVEKYILRPSFDWEDSLRESYAGFFKSFFPLTKEELIKKLKNKNLAELLWWKWFKLKSIIIQEFIEADLYWVYFSRNPNNILEKWWYNISKTNDWVTSWKKIKSTKELTFFIKKDLENISKFLENKNTSPQDIEFCLKKWKIILLQSRAITTWNETIYNFSEIVLFNWIYNKIDFPEFWKDLSVFTYSILENIIKCIYLWKNIYFKKWLSLFNRNKISLLNDFVWKYRKYLKTKIGYSILEIFSLQKLDLEILNKFYKDYNFSFDLFENSNLDISFDYKTNFLTRKKLKLEKLKYDAFKELEKIKKEILVKNIYWTDINYLKIKEFLNNSEAKNRKLIIKRKNINILDYNNKLIFIKGINILSNDEKQDTWIYKWKIKWYKVNVDNIKEDKSIKQVLFINDLSYDIFDKLKYISWVVVKYWSIYSHNSIILRESKIPSIISKEIYLEFQSNKKVEI